MYVDTIGSFYNPAEAYPYYSLPVCAPSEVVDISPSWGDLLSGSRRQTSVYDIKFGQSAKRQVSVMSAYAVVCGALTLRLLECMQENVATERGQAVYGSD